MKLEAEMDGDISWKKTTEMKDMEASGYRAVNTIDLCVRVELDDVWLTIQKSLIMCQGKEPRCD